MTGYKIELRQIGNPNALVDMRYIGEIYYSVANNSLCICNGPGILQYPDIDLSHGRMTLPRGFVLTGKSNSVRFDWGESQNLTIRSGTGIPIVRFGLTTQHVRKTMDAVYNRTGYQSLEHFGAGNEDSTFTLTPTTIKKVYKSGGNLWVEQYGTPKNISGTISISNNDSADHIKGVRFSKKSYYSPHLYSRGRLTIKDVRRAPYFTGLYVRSKMHYPNAAKHDLTFLMLYTVETVPTRFATRIGWEGNYQTYVTEITDFTNKKNGCVAFHFRADRVDPANVGKPIEIDWVYDLFSGGNLTSYITRGISIAGLSVVPGNVPAASFNPSFPDFATEQTYTTMYGVENRTQYMKGREYEYVNFEVPMINANYTITVHTSLYVVEVSQKTRYGFVCRSLQSPYDERWKFTYSVKI